MNSPDVAEHFASALSRQPIKTPRDELITLIGEDEAVRARLAEEGSLFDGYPRIWLPFINATRIVCEAC